MSLTPSNPVVERLRTRIFEFHEIPLTDLRVDARLPQRGVDPLTVRLIKKRFQPQGLGVIFVADLPPTRPGDPPYAIIDGQARVRAVAELQLESESLLERGIVVPTSLRAQIVYGAEVDECALLYGFLGRSRPVGQSDLQRARVVAGHRVMGVVVDQLRACGHTIFPEDPMETPPTVNSATISKAEMIVRWGIKDDRPTLLSEAVQIQTAAFLREDQRMDGTLHPLILQATAALLRKNPNLDPTHLAKVMHDRSGILFERDRLVERGQISEQRITLCRAIQMVLVERYNKGRTLTERIEL